MVQEKRPRAGTEPATTRTCRVCRHELTAAAFTGSATTCDVCADAPAVAIAGAVDVGAILAGNRGAVVDLTAAMDGDTSRMPMTWDQYRRSDALDDWIQSETAALLGQSAEAKRRLRQVEREVKAEAAKLEIREPSPEWSIMVGLPLVAEWDHARRLAGVPPILETLRPARRYPLGGTGDALALIVLRTIEVGRSGGGWQRTTDEEKSKRRVADAARDEREGIFRAAVAADRPEHVAAKMLAAHRGRPRPLDADGRETPGYLPADFMPAKQSANGSTGGAAQASAIELRVDVWRAIHAAGIGPIDLQLLVWRDVGEWQTVPAKQRIGDRSRDRPQQALVRLSAAEIAARLTQRRERVGLDPVTPEAAGKRIKASRWALAEKLQEWGLIPPMRVAERKSAVHVERSRPEPIEPARVGLES